MVFYSEFQQIYLWLPLVGMIVGLLATMIGSGGGFFFPLILMLFFRTPAHIAVATSLAATLPLCMVGSVGHYRQGNIHLRLVLVFGAAGVLGAVAGAWITQQMDTQQLKMAFGIYSLVLAAVIILNSRKNKKQNKNREKEGKRLKKSLFAQGSAYGFAGGIISGTFGTSGSAPVLAGLVALNAPIKLVVGTSLTVVLINTVSALAGHALIGEIDLTLVLLLTTGTLIGAAAGPRLLGKIKIERSEGHIRQWFALIIFGFGLILIFA
ncbi:sulfite exporter TauE/SafE family protein [Mariniphaga sp.]|uniref:sulfite exporter TauE/SafE family protein n=1 Tax=Mariniphaga sp. TaxID=1954475 RepID=UPI003565A513